MVSNDIPVDTLDHTDDGWGFFMIHNKFLHGYPLHRNHRGNRIQINTSGGSYAFRKYLIKRSNELGTNMPVTVEPLEVPSSAEQAPALMERTFPDVVHLVQYGIVPERITLPRPDDEILSGYDEYVSFARDGYAIWGLTDPGFALMRHLVTSGSAKPVFRCAHDPRLSSPKPEYRFDNNRRNRLLE